MNEKITYIIPSKSRPKKLIDLIEYIVYKSHDSDYEIILSLDTNDSSMNHTSVITKLFNYTRVTPVYGFSNNKVHACNREIYRISPDTKIVVLLSDDFVITNEDFDIEMREAFADGFSGLCHFPDGRMTNMPLRTHSAMFSEWTVNNGWHRNEKRQWENFNQVCLNSMYEVYDLWLLEQNKRIVTLPIMSKEYLDSFGYFYHQDYKSLMCDLEMTDVSKMLKKYRYVDKRIFQHEHYRNGFGQPDELMKRNEDPKLYELDKVTYQRRAEINFGIPKQTT